MSVASRSLLRFHRYAGLLVAPLVIFFAVSGAWQIFRLQQDRKDGSYKAPAVLRIASDLHKAEDLDSSSSAVAFKVSATLISAFLAATTFVGIILALRSTRPRWLAIALLLLGALVPPLLYVLARW